MEIASELHDLLHLRWDYAKAVDLYNQIGKNDIWKMTFGLGENSFNTEKLRQELTALEPQYPFTTQRRQAIEEKLPSDVLALEQQWKRLFKEASQWNHNIFSCDRSGNPIHTEEERRVLAFKVRDHFDEIERLWGAVDYFLEHGHIPPSFNKVELEPMDRESMLNRLRNLRTYISKAKKGTKKYKLTVEQMEAEAAELERRLKS